MERKWFFVVGECVPSSNPTWYGGATKYQCQTFVKTTSKDISEVATLTASLSPITNYDIVSIDGLCRHYAALLYECDRCINVNLKAQNTPAILNAPDGQELTFANLYEQVAGHKPVVYTRDMSPLKISMMIYVKLSTRRPRHLLLEMWNNWNLCLCQTLCLCWA